MDLFVQRKRPHRPQRARASRAGRFLRLLLTLALALVLAACQTTGPADPSDPDPNEPAPTEPGPQEPGPGDPPPDDLPLSEIEIALQPIAEGASFERPLGVVSDGATDLLYVMQQTGLVRIVDGGNVRAEAFLDLPTYLEMEGESLVTSGESGLLGLVFHPEYDPSVVATRFVFVHYTASPATDDSSGMRTVVSRMPVGADGLAIEEQELELFTVDQPGEMHNGGQLAFGPDDMLYVALGEGNAGAIPSLARDPMNPHGSILRLDPDAAGSDFVATGNPFADGSDGNPYVWHYGLRNPWRFSFDEADGALWVADVGEDDTEEVNRVSVAASGLDFGWDRMEGNDCIDPMGCEGFEATRPVLTYQHPSPSERRSVTGGYVYRGAALPELVGHYVFGDYMSGDIMVARPVGEAYEAEVLLPTEAQISSFGVDADGELIVVDYGDYDWDTGALQDPAALYRIVPADDAGEGASSEP